MWHRLWLTGVMAFLFLISGILSQTQAQESEGVIKVIEPEETQEVETSTPATAKKDKVEDVEKIVVTATKTARNPDDVPASITVITKEDIRKQNIQTVDEALAQIPGTFQKRSKGWTDAHSASVNLRGFPAESQKRTLILLDGQNISSGYSNSVSWNSMPVEYIERIEVIRGPFSALYGGSAMGGVINIITRTPKKLEFLAQGGYSTYDSWTYYLGAGDRLWDKLSIQGGFNYRYTAGYASNLVRKTASSGAASPTVLGWSPTTTTTGSPTNIIGDNGDNYWSDYNLNGKASWDIAEGHKVTFNTLVSYSNTGYDLFNSYLTNTATGAKVVTGTVGLFGTDTKFSNLQEGAFLSSNVRNRTQVFNLASEHSLTETTKLKFHAGLLNMPESWGVTPNSSSPQTTYYGGPGSKVSFPSQNWVAELQVDQAIGNKHQLVGGISYNTGSASSETNNLDNWRKPDMEGILTKMSGGRDRNTGIFLQDEIAWHPKINTVAGLRLDWWETYGGRYMAAAGTPVIDLGSRSKVAVSPKFAVLYRPWQWMAWRASVGTSFRAPNIYELYGAHQSATYVYKNNPDLKPETTLSWEIGTTLKPFEGTVFTSTYFENYVDDLIYRVTDPTDPTGRTQIIENAAKATIRGVELEINQKICSWLEVFGNTTLVDARINENPYNQASVGKKITMTPRQMFNFGVTANYWKFQANLSGRYVSKLYATDNNSDVVNNVYGSYDPYFTLDSKVIFSPVKYMDVSFSVNNMLNREYYSYYRTPGQTFWTQVTLKY
ncbi:TonB-dependent receptor [Desulfobacca acetoxidans]|uniref:TonB-dependent receptor plug n=1 Tax=Desulfobacca acetoxidans (strain ATCC 700848 / DSM 11109 / ASRB2) TaxID=880072 RepID=F2NEP3_DESAR|nr:TonB-dependent receptor [Desulfobacca acetoxidans]AEB08233.1 TonB-dependent receptor plug [Desulfobacca acetoxidans DSM 11109]